MGRCDARPWADQVAGAWVIQGVHERVLRQVLDAVVGAGVRFPWRCGAFLLLFFSILRVAFVWTLFVQPFVPSLFNFLYFSSFGTGTPPPPIFPKIYHHVGS